MGERVSGSTRYQEGFQRKVRMVDTPDVITVNDERGKLRYEAVRGCSSELFIHTSSEAQADGSDPRAFVAISILADDGLGVYIPLVDDMPEAFLKAIAEANAEARRLRGET